MSSFLDKLNRFAKNPVHMDFKRSKFNLSHGAKLTMNSGYLVPVLVDEILPDDTIKIDVSSVIRSLTVAVPVMDNAYLDLYAFWCPARICCVHDKDWEKVAGENVAGYWAPATESTLENTGNTFKFVSGYPVQAQSLADYMGIPIGFYNANVGISRLPFNGYWEIWNQWFRDQNVDAPIDWKAHSSNDTGFRAGQATLLAPVNKFHDYFTSALPAPQKGNSVLLPMVGNAPVITGADHQTTFKGTIGVNTVSAGSMIADENYPLYNHASAVPQGWLTHGSTSAGTSVGNTNYIQFTNLYADLSNATAASVNDLRQAFALQKLFEKDARGGTRYREILLAHFGVSIPDNTIQVPEYLGGKRIPLNMLQVLQTTPTTNAPVGTTGAFSNTADSSYICTKSFSEFGYVYVLACIRTNQGYSQGVSKMFTRNRRYDFYDPVFANIGEMPVKTIELYANNSSDLITVFGYQEAWAEYRFKPTKICGYLSANSGDSVAQLWTYGNKFVSAPVLNGDFMKQPKSQIGNTLAITNPTYQFVCDFFINYTSWRAMPYFSVPGLIDHH